MRRVLFFTTAVYPSIYEIYTKLGWPGKPRASD